MKQETMGVEDEHDVVSELDPMEIDQEGETTTESESMEVDNEVESDSSNERMHARLYQIELLNMAIKNNLIICLPTGSGKTYIAVQLAKRYFHSTEKKKIFFLANTVHLVEQQYMYFRDHFNFPKKDKTDPHRAVQKLTGYMNVDYWEKSHWDEVLDNSTIFIMTAQICKDMLEKKYVYFNQISLLILDECHNASKEHPMAKIMAMYKTYGQNTVGETPRVLGLTATIIKGKGNLGEIPTEVREVEETMCAKAVTYHDYEEVLRYSTKSEVEFLTYKKENDAYFQNKKICEPVDRCVSYLRMVTDLMKGRGNRLMKVDHPAFRADHVYGKQQGPNDIIRVLNEILNIYQTLGPYCARLAAMSKKLYLETSFRKITGYSKLLDKAVITALTNFILKIERLMSRATERESDLNKRRSLKLDYFASNKLTTLRDFVCANSKDIAERANEDTDLACTLVFVRTRLTAQVIAWYFQDYLKYWKWRDIAPILPGCLIGLGAGRTSMETPDVRAVLTMHKKIIAQFHAGEINLLIATSVLEEGLNVRKCNVVVRFDSIDTYPSFVQSMGRARKENSRFVILSEESANGKDMDSVQDYTEYNKGLGQYLTEHALHADSDDFFNSSEENGSPVEPFCPKGPFEPMIDSSSAVQLLMEYCSLLPCDRFVTLAPVAWWTEHENGFKAFVQLPRNAILKKVVEGKAQSSKGLAKRSAFLEACIELYHAGAFTENFKPKPRDLPQSVKDIVEAKEESKVTFSACARWHSKMRPQFYSNLLNDGGYPCTYVIKINPQFLNSLNDGKKCEINAKVKILNIEQHNYCFGFIATNEAKMFIESMPEFCLNDKYGTVKCTIEPAVYEVDPNLHNDLKDFQKYLYNQVLLLTKNSLDFLNGLPIMLCPLKKGKRSSSGTDGRNSFHIDKNLLGNIKGFSYEKLLIPPTSPSMLNRSEYEDAVVVPFYRPDEYTTYCVADVTDLTPQSPFVTTNYKSYSEYFEKRYGLQVTDQTQPLLCCVRLANQLNFLSDKTSETKRTSSKNHGVVMLIPEFVNKHSLPASLFAQSRYIPSILHRMERMCLAMELKLSVAKDFSWNSAMELKRKGSDAEEVDLVVAIPDHIPPTQGSSVHNWPKKQVDPMPADILVLEFLHPDTIVFPKKEEHPVNPAITQYENEEMDTLEDLEPDDACILDLPKPNELSFGQSLDFKADFEKEAGPDAFEIMKCITLANAEDDINLERLETIGDSFLKYAVSTHLYWAFPDGDEGFLTRIRNTLISNKHLFHCGIEKKLGKILSGCIFKPDSTWLPPGFIYNEIMETRENNEANTNISVAKKRPKSPTHSNYKESKVSDKSIADCVEAIIGAYFTNGGRDAAFRVMEWLGLKGPLNDSLSGSVFYGNWKPPVKVRNSSALPRNIRELVPGIDNLLDVIGYQFQDEYLLGEAFLHPSFPCRNELECYQRLEFIGDAILDFLITNHIYSFKLNGKYRTPGQLTDLRSALVNNVTFGSLAVRYKLHLFLMCHSRELQQSIDAFVAYQDCNGHKVTGHFEKISEFDATIARDIEVPKVLGDIFESLIGAIYIDSGFSLDATWKVVYRLMKKDIDFFSFGEHLSPVRKLYEMFNNEVKFSVHELKRGDVKSNEIVMKATIQNKTNFYGVGKNKVSARQAAAKIALAFYKKDMKKLDKLGRPERWPKDDFEKVYKTKKMKRN